MKKLTIGILARKANVHVETIRYYERKSLIVQPPRSEGGYRIYSEDAVARVRFIKRAQELGFTLKEIAELLSLRIEPRRHLWRCADALKNYNSLPEKNFSQSRKDQDPALPRKRVPRSLRLTWHIHPKGPNFPVRSEILPESSG